MSNNSQLNVDFINFIAEKVKKVKSPMNLSELSKEFKKKNGASSTDNKLFHRVQRIRNKMSEMENFDTETKVKMMFALGSPVSNGLLIELKKQADVELDGQHRIIKYKQYETDFQLSGVHTAFRRFYDIEKEKRMLKFLAKKSENATTPMTDRTVLREFNSLEGNSERNDNFHTRYNLIKQQIYLTPEFDQKTKIRMMFLSNSKIHANILEELRQNAVVEVDEHQRITKYNANDGSLELEGERKKLPTILGPAKAWTKEENDKLLNFIAGKSKQTNVPLPIKPLCREFARLNGVSRTMHAVNHYVRQLLPKISKLNDFDMESKIRMIFALSVPVDEEFLNKIRKKAVVEIDEEQRLTKYEANDESLKLDGDHSMSAKVKAGLAREKSINGISETSEIDEDDVEVEEEEKNEDDEVEDEESKEEEEEVEAISFTRRSERISKKRYPNNDFTCDFDGFMFNSPTKAKDSKIEKETEKLVEMPSDSSSKTTLVKNLKRKILENSFDATSLFSKTRKYERVSTGQNDAKSNQIASGTNQNDNEVKYDVTEGSLSYKEVKLEEEEYKPDLSFLCNTTQNYMQIFSGTEENHTDVVDQSTENIEEMTSGKEFMKLLGGLVKTLDSPILLELQSKIEEAIERLGDGDHKILIDDIGVALNTGLIILNKNATIQLPKGESTSLRDFFLILRSTLSTFHSSSLNTFQLKLKENIKKLDSQDKIIPIESIRPVLETVLLLATP